MKKIKLDLLLILVASSVLVFQPTKLDAQTASNVTISRTDATLRQIIGEVEKQTRYLFIYDNTVNVDFRLSVSETARPIGEVLEKILGPTDIAYRIEGNHIILSRRETPAARSAADLRTVSGTVTDRSGAPIQGVTIYIRATNIGTLSDASGNYSLTVPEGAQTLTYSFIGYESVDIDPGARTLVNVVLEEIDQVLDEIVVVGYGQQKKLELTSAVSSIKTAELTQSPVANITSALAGRLPGLVTIQNSGEPGADGTNLWIRGQGTYNGSTSPLIMVDGIERDIHSIDANEIEDITILKDASATAVYGVRGANGVVLVTTKRGNVDKARISFTYQVGITSPTRLPRYLDAYDALTLKGEGYDNDGIIRPENYLPETIEKYRDRSVPSYEYLYPNVDWMDVMLKDHSVMHQANLNISGGGSVTRYFVSASYLKQEGLYNFDDSIEQYSMQATTQRYNYRSNIDVNLAKNLTMELNLGGYMRERNYPGAYGAADIFSMLKTTPSWAYPFTNPDGSNAATRLLTSYRNPYTELTQRGYKKNFDSQMNGTLGFKLNLPWVTEGLSIRTRLSYDTYHYRNLTRSKSPDYWEFSIYDELEQDLSLGEYFNLQEGTAGGILGHSVSANASRKYLVEVFLNYDRTFGKHGVRGLLLYDQGEETKAIASGQTNAIDGLPYRRQGFKGRFNYSYDDRYFIEANFAFNGSEQFASGHRFGFFPSGSIGWVVSNENFMKSAVPVINLLKLRFSAGMVGNDNWSNRFLYQSRWSTGVGGYQFGITGGGLNLGNGAEEGQPGNVGTTWERATKYNLGLDLSLLRNSLRFELDLFFEHRTHILTSPASVVPKIVGLPAYPSLNAGIVDNKGFEVDVEYRKSFNRHSFFVRGNFSFNRNKIIDCLEPPRTGREYYARTGRRIAEKTGLVALGLFKDEEDIVKSPKQAWGDIQPGDIKYKDMNGDGVVDAKDVAYLGKVGVPPMMGGFSAGYRYRGFDLSVLFQGALGGDIYVRGDEVYPFSKNTNALYDVKDNHYNAHYNPDPNAKYPRLSSQPSDNNYRDSSYWLKSNDFLRLKNVEIGYSLPSKLLKKFNIHSIRIFANGLNLYTWDHLKIFDPEISDGSGTYPQQRVYNFGINIVF